MDITYADTSLFTKAPTYAMLQTLIAHYINRTDEEVLNMMPLFINNAEKSVLRNLRIPSMEKTSNIELRTLPDGNTKDSWIYLVSDYLEMIHMFVDGKQAVRYNYADVVGNTHGCSEDHDEIPYARVGERWIFPSGTLTKSSVINVHYYADPLELSPTIDNSLLLTLAPDVILYASCAEAFMFIDKSGEDGRTMYWDGKAKERIAQIVKQSRDAEFSGINSSVSQRRVSW